MYCKFLPKVKFPFVFLLFFLIFLACNSSKNIEGEVLEFQEKIDSLLVGVVVPMQEEIDVEILARNEMGKDTFQLARQRVPITKVQFLISNEYFELEEALKMYAQHKIDAKTLSEQLEKSKIRVDSLINYDLKEIENYSNSEKK